MAMAVVLGLQPTSAKADQTLVMPYTCSMASGRPTLRPSDQHGHAIIGEREERSFRACSPVNPNQCRTWILHRFIMDCDGATVPWVTVAANANPVGRRRPTLQNGRMILAMPPSWTVADDDPCARGPTYDPRWNYGPLGRHCADLRALSPPAIVELPPGFAPMFEFDGIFVGPQNGNTPYPAGANTPSATWRAPRQESSAFTNPSDGRQATAPPLAAGTTLGDAPRTEKPASNSAASLKPAVKRNPTDASTPLIPANPAANYPRATVAASNDTPQRSGATQVPPVVPSLPTPLPVPAPTILPSQQTALSTPPLAASGAPAPPQTVTPASETAGSLAVKSSVATATAPAGKPNAPSPEIAPPAQPKTDTVGMLSADRMDATRPIKLYAAPGFSRFTLAAFATALISLSLTGLWLLRRTPGSNIQPRRNTAGLARDIGAVTLDGLSLKPGLLEPTLGDGIPGNADAPLHNMHQGAQERRRPQFAETSLTLQPDSPQVSRPPALSHPSAFPPLAVAASIPKTRHEALEILGMGVGDNASTVAMKKIVDGLRLSWHPDLATSDADRPAREQRIRQINAAWDILAKTELVKTELDPSVSVIPERL